MFLQDKGSPTVNLSSFGHCPNSHWDPPTRTQTGKIMQMPVCTWTFLLKIGATSHPGKGLDPLPQTGNAQMNRDFLMVGLPLRCLRNNRLLIDY